MSRIQNDQLLQVETTCGSLLYELQIIWDEVGESSSERDKMLLAIEQECLEVYRRKVDQANRSRAQIRQAIADSEAELAAICSAMGERPVHRQSDQKPGSLKEELIQILPQLEDMQKRKSDRRNQFFEVLEQIQKISNEIYGSEYNLSKIVLDETDLSLRKLEGLHVQLQALEKEKSDRLKLVQERLYALNSLCVVLGVDFKQTIIEIHPTLDCSGRAMSITNNSIEQLASAIQNLREVKLHRMQRLQDLAATMLELWNLMDTPIEEQQTFQKITCNVAASEHEFTEPNTLSVDSINHVEAEVLRLEEMKSSKMKELVLKKKSELEEICRKSHIVPEEDAAVESAIEDIDSGIVDPACILDQIELQIGKVKEETFMRKEILEKVEKWLTACEEECWLEEYNRDENRYNAGRGTHLTLKHAEKARSLVNKLPGMIDSLASKALAWEKERGIEFTYDGIRLLSMLEEYSILRQEKEKERRRQREQKKLHGQLKAEQEAIYGSKPSPTPSKPPSGKKTPRMSTGGVNNRKFSLAGATNQTPKPDSVHSTKATPYSRPTRNNDQVHQNGLNMHPEDGFQSVSAGKRGLDSLPVKDHSFGAGDAPEVESMTRKPFSPISTAEQPTEENPTSSSDNINSKNSEKTLQKPILSTDVQFATPSKKLTCVIDEEENKTPKAMPIPMPLTPSTASIQMQMAMTPAPSPVPLSSWEEDPEEIDYSFEERRAGFVLSKTQHMESMIQV